MKLPCFGEIIQEQRRKWARCQLYPDSFDLAISVVLSEYLWGLPGNKPQVPSGIKADKGRARFLSLNCSPAHYRRSLQSPHPEVYADSGNEGSGQEGPVFELDQETGFADARVAKKHHLGDGGRSS